MVSKYPMHNSLQIILFTFMKEYYFRNTYIYVGKIIKVIHIYIKSIKAIYKTNLTFIVPD